MGSSGQEAEGTRAVRDHIWNWHRILGDILLVIAVIGPVQT